MSVIMQANPFDFFADRDGEGLDAGYVWVGQPNQDPRQFPAQVFYDEALTIPAIMPLRTVSGYISRNGTPTLLYLSGNYSIRVEDKRNMLVYSVPDVFLIGNSDAVSRADLANTTDPLKGAGMVGASTDDGDPTTVSQMIGAYINVLAQGSGNDATAEIQSFINGGTAPRLRRGVFRVTAPIVLEPGASLHGRGWQVLNNNVSTLLNGESSTILLDHDGPVFVWDGDKDTGNFADGFNFSNFAIYSPSKGVGTMGFNLDAFRAGTFDRLYLYNMIKGIYGNGQSWQNVFKQVWTNGCTTGIESNGSIEDSTLISCVLRFGDIGLKQNFSGQTNLALGCDFSRNRLGVLLNSGSVFNGHMSIINAQIELNDTAEAGIRIESASSLLPSITVEGCRFLSLETVPTAPCIRINDAADVVTQRNTARGVKDFISVRSAAIPGSKVTRISDELNLVGGFPVAGDDGTFVTTIDAGRISLPLGSNKGVQVGGDIFVRRNDAGSKEVVLDDSIVSRGTDGELSIITASAKSVRLKPGGIQTVVASSNKTSITNQPNLSGAPTSPSGLVAGDVWVDTGAANVLKRV